jgi:hypothetical protein
MVKEDKNIDFSTTGKQPSDVEFAKISDWILKNKARDVKKKKSFVNTTKVK